MKKKNKPGTSVVINAFENMAPGKIYYVDIAKRRLLALNPTDEDLLESMLMGQFIAQAAKEIWDERQTTRQIPQEK